MTLLALVTTALALFIVPIPYFSFPNLGPEALTVISLLVWRWKTHDKATWDLKCPRECRNAGANSLLRMLSSPCHLLGWDMDRATLRCQDGLAQALTECRVCVYRLNNLIRREFIAQSKRAFRNQVRHPREALDPHIGILLFGL